MKLDLDLEQQLRMCRMIYAAGARAVAGGAMTGDLTKWPDVLAFKFPVLNLSVLLRYMGVTDEDLVAALVAAAPSTTSDDAAFDNVLTAALAEAARRAA
jgi:hypothetical protein